jgi:hypothetical protein
MNSFDLMISHHLIHSLHLLFQCIVLPLHKLQETYWDRLHNECRLPSGGEFRFIQLIYTQFMIYCRPRILRKASRSSLPTMMQYKTPGTPWTVCSAAAAVPRYSSSAGISDGLFQSFIAPWMTSMRTTLADRRRLKSSITRRTGRHGCSRFREPNSPGLSQDETNICRIIVFCYNGNVRIGVYDADSITTGFIEE